MPAKQYVIVDGYNLMHLVGSRLDLSAPGNLERARNGLVGQLAGLLDSDLQTRTTIVFDVHSGGEPQAPAAAHQMTILFATDFDSADSMIEDLLTHHSAPKQVLVVSSDRRLQEFARRRRAQSIGSDTWWQQLQSSPQQTEGTPSAEDDELLRARERGELDQGERDYWLREFRGET